MFSDIKIIFFYIAIFTGLYFQVFLLVSYFLWDGKTEFGEIDEGATDDSYEPTVSIMIPCWNEETTVAGTVNSLLALDYPREKLTIIVIDDGSTDSTWQVVQQFANNPSVLLLHKENEGSKFAALNYGLRHVTSEVVGCLDADSSVHPQALRESVREFTKPGVMAVIPSMIIDKPKSFFQIMQKVEYELATYSKQVFSRLNALYIAPGPFTLFKKEVFDKLGDYREAHHVEDMELALRMQINGMRLSHAVGSLVYTKGPRTWGALLKQRVRWTYGFIMNVWDHLPLLRKNNVGHLTLVLPFLFATLVLSVTLIPLMILGLLTPIVALIQKIIVAHHLFGGKFHFEWFFINTSAYSMLSYLTLAFLLVTIFIGRKRFLKQNAWSFDLLTLIVYPFFSAWWTGQSAYNAIRRKKKAWR